MNMGYLSICLCLLQFLSPKSCSFPRTDLFTPQIYSKNFIVFDAIVNGIVFFIYFSYILLLVYGNATTFCMLILYPANLLNLLISSNSFLEESLGFSLYKIISSANKDSFTSFFSVWMPFILFFSLTVLVRISSSMLNRSG